MGPLARGALGSAAAASAVAAVWTVVSFASGWNLPILAIVVGACAGMGMAHGSLNRAGAVGGLVAAAIALMTILGSRLILTRLELAVNLKRSAHVSDLDAQALLADRIYDEFLRDGVEFSWSDESEDYPPEVLAQADAAWEKLTPEQREELKASMAAENRAEFAEYEPIFTGIGLLLNFGLVGLTSMGVGLAAAFRMGSVVERLPAAMLKVDSRSGVPARAPAPPVTSGPFRLRAELDDPLEGTAAGNLSLTERARDAA